MDLVTITIDDRQIQAEKGARLLDVADANGIYIPRLCYYKGLSVYGGCRVCVVEIEGQRGQPLSCTTYITEGMVVRTDTPALSETRRSVIELIQADHPGRCFDCFRTIHCPPGWICLRDEAVSERCLTCAKNGRCELQSTTEYINLRGYQHFFGEKQFWYEKQKYSPPRRDNPFIEFEWSKCILCTRCVRVCDEVRGRAVYGLDFRGGQAKVNTAFGLPLQDTNCDFCGLCVEVCPTAAIMYKESKWTTNGPPAPAVVAEYNRQRGLEWAPSEEWDGFRRPESTLVPRGGSR